MVIFSPQPKKKYFCIRQSDPQEESKCKNAQFLQKILKYDDVYFKKNHCILNLWEFFHSEKYRAFTQHAATALLRHWATMG